MPLYMLKWRNAMSQISINSASDAEKAWINYYYHGNTMQITDVQMGEIVGRYSSFIPTWRNYAESQDTNEYELSDETFEDSVDRGYEYGQDLTDYDNTGWDKTKQIGRTVVDGSTAAAAGVHAMVSGGEAAGSIVSTTAKEAAKTTTKEVSAKGFSALPGADFLLLGFCATDMVDAVRYKVSKPNKEQVEAVNVLAEDMLNQQTITTEAQDTLMEMDSELSDSTDEAIDVRDVANNDMSDSKTLYEFHADKIKYYDKAKTAGYEFTQEDVESYQESLQFMTELSDDVNVTQEEADKAVGEIYEEMKDYQSGFDDAADSIAEVEGVTDYAEGFDELTQTNCKAESYIQYVNTGSSGIDAVSAAGKVVQYAGAFWVAAAFAAAGALAAGAAVMDGTAAKEQSDWSDEAGNEVGLREGTQELNESSLQTYNENVDYYDGYMQNVEDLNIVRPDDMEAPEAEVPTVGKQDGNDPKNPYNPKNNKKQEKP